MPFRLSCGPDYRRTVIVSRSASEALKLYEALEAEGHENVEVARLDAPDFGLDDLRRLADEEGLNAVRGDDAEPGTR